MPKTKDAVINYAIYEDANEFYGTAQVQLPDLNSLTTTLSGAGIAGNVEVVIRGHMDAMSMTINFNTFCKEQAALAEQRPHNLDIRVAQQGTDSTSGELGVDAIKHIARVTPKSLKYGKIAPAATADASGEYAVSYLATYINGEKINEIDPLNFICIINGTDYLAEVRKALGKN